MGKSLATKAILQGYYWPTVKRDANDFIQKCNRCQRLAKYTKLPPSELTMISSPRPFVWGIDSIGALPTSKYQAKHAVVAVDYFTKWAEAEPLARITVQKLVDFVKRSYVDLASQRILFLTTRQFKSEQLKKFCAKYGIQKSFALVVHPQSSRQVEVVNKLLEYVLMTKLEQAEGLWVEQLPVVLQAYRTTRRGPMVQTPFALTYRAETMV